MKIQNALLYSGAAFFIPRTCSYVCDYSHPILEREDHFLNDYLPKWLIHICHAERAYWDATASNESFSAWNISLYDSLWIAALFTDNLISSKGYAKGIGYTLGLSVTIEMVRIFSQGFFNLPSFLHTSSSDIIFSDIFFNLIEACLYAGDDSAVMLFPMLAIIDLSFLIYFPIARAFNLPVPFALQNQYPELFLNHEDANFEAYYENVDINDLPEDNREDPIYHIEMENPVKLRVCDHVFERASIEQWLQINPTCPLCRCNVRN